MIAANHDHNHNHDQTPSTSSVPRRGQKIGGDGGGRWGASVGWAVVVTIVGWIGFATVAVAHPHEWYDVIAAEAVIGENAAVAEIRLRLLPEPFTHASLIMAADADGDGMLSSAELGELEAMYAPIWEQVRYFTHPTLNGKTLLDMRGQRPKFVPIVGPDGQPWLEAHVSVTVTIDEPLKRINNFTVLVADMSLYSALAIRPGSASVRLAPPARAISVVQPDRGRFRVTFVWPDPATTDTATDTATDASNTHHTNTGNTDTTGGPIAALPVENSGGGDVWMAEAPTEKSVAEWIAESAQWAQNEAYTRFVTLRAGLDLNVLAVLILMAMLWGMLHALGPGHGKGLVAAFLVQSNGRLRDALKLGFLIAYVHTGGAILLVGAVKLAADVVQQKQFLDGAEAWLGFASGCAIALLGGWLVWERLGGHDHHDETAPAGTTNLRKMALAVGIVPCPAATIVMLLALSAQAFWIGAMVVVALAFGIAIVLSGVGALVVVSRRRLTAAVAHVANHHHQPQTQTQTARRSTSPNRAMSAPVVAAATPAFATAPAAATVAAADGFTRDADIEWLDDGDDIGIGIGIGTGGTISAITTGADTAEIAAVAEAVGVDRRPRGLRVLEQVLGVGGAVMVSIFGVGLAWYYAVWVLPRFLGH